MKGTCFEVASSHFNSARPLECDSRAVGLLDGHQHGPGNRCVRDRIHNLPADARIVHADLAGSQHRFKSILAVALPDDRSTGVEVDIQVDALSTCDLNGSADNLSGRDFQAGIGPTAEVELMYRRIAQNNAIVAVSRTGVG